MGKEEGMLHENDAAEVLCSMCKGEHMERSQAKEGKIELSAACDGLLKVDNKGLKAVNGFGQMMIATRHGNFAVKKGDKLAGTRIIPLVIEEEKMTRAKEAAMAATGNKPILNLLPFKHKKSVSLLLEMKFSTEGSKIPLHLLLKGKWQNLIQRSLIM